MKYLSQPWSVVFGFGVGLLVGAVIIAVGMLAKGSAVEVVFQVLVCAWSWPGALLMWLGPGIFSLQGDGRMLLSIPIIVFGVAGWLANGMAIRWFVNRRLYSGVAK